MCAPYYAVSPMNDAPARRSAGRGPLLFRELHPGRSPEQQTKEYQQSQDDETSHAAALLYPWKREFAPYRARGDNRVAALLYRGTARKRKRPPCGTRVKRLEKGIGKRFGRPLPDRYGACAPPTTRLALYYYASVRLVSGRRPLLFREPHPGRSPERRPTTSSGRIPGAADKGVPAEPGR